MTYLFRMISANKWYKEPGEFWFEKEIPADIISDLRTIGNTLSVFALKHRLGTKRSIKEITKISVALATTQFGPKHIDYVLLDKDKLISLGFEVVKSPGDTADSEVNDTHWDISKLKGTDLIKLALFIDTIRIPPFRARIFKEDIYPQLKSDIKKKRLNLSQIKITDNKIRKEIGLPQREWVNI